ncbi:bifunctional 2',3'-cyclic-nucleotide 2'-phosphodiesterase/3'-nucleotidase [Acetobacter sp.]|uniref:bifunctional 2',3'-cyclic-nucleotide 2'-phosphodiesterase/3'-nucleotidase n=1 Tax=Acetobacter sp. TaxID=440 RepID=UPI0039E8FD8E
METNAVTQGALLRLRIMETSDLHMFLCGWDYYRGQEEPRHGLSRVASLIHQAREESTNSLLFDNGDAFQGSPMGDFVASRAKDADAHPMIRAMNSLGYDAVALGNHEFNYGLPFLQSALTKADFPVVCSNVTWMDGRPFALRSTILKRAMVDENGTIQSIRIGVVAFLPPQIMVWDALYLTDQLIVTDMVEAARTVLPEVRAQCDLLIALCHCGISAAERRGGEENAALYLAELSEIDVLLLGHTHHVFPGPGHENLSGVNDREGCLHGKPAVMPGFWGSHLGVIDLTLRNTATGWICENFQTDVRPVCPDNGAPAPEDRMIVEIVRPEHEATVSWMDEALGRTSAPLQNWFTFLGPDPCLSLVNAAQLSFASAIQERSSWSGIPLLSAASPFHAGCMATDMFVDIPQGPLTVRNLACIYPFANTLSIVRCTGAELHEWLERAVAIFNKVDAPQDLPLLDPHCPVYTFDEIDGGSLSGPLTYTVDVTQPRRYSPQGMLISPEAHRIRDLRLDGVLVKPGQDFVIVTNNYRAFGGGHFPGTGADHVLLTTRKQNREILFDYVKEHGTISPVVSEGWRFAQAAAEAYIDLPLAAEVAAASRADLRYISRCSEEGLRYAVTLGAHL